MLIWCSDNVSTSTDVASERAEIASTSESCSDFASTSTCAASECVEVVPTLERCVIGGFHVNWSVLRFDVDFSLGNVGGFPAYSAVGTIRLKKLQL